MRIIGGKYKGRRIVPWRNFKARPTTDFAREGLFNILNNRISFDLIDVLDLFAGTGSIGFEFASRGASSVYMIEKDMNHIAGIRHIIKEIGFENIKPVHIDVRAYLKACSMKYDIIFADPPYELSWLKELPDLIAKAEISKQDGFLVLEHPKSLSFSGHKLFFEHRNYGGVNFSFFRLIYA